MDSPIRRVLREPLLHFALLGAVIFAAHAALRPAPEPDPRRIALDDGFLDALVERDRLAGGDGDRDAVAARWIRDEALAREAVRLGLDEGDAVLRRRLVQKMELWLEAHLALDEPDEDDLEAERAAHPERYRIPARITFAHRFFASARPDAIGDARDALAAGAPASAGDPFLLGARFEASPRAEVVERLGAGFAEALDAAPVGAWSGPVQSAFGVHLVRVEARTPARVPPLAEVRERARDEVLRARRAEARREAERALVARYAVERRP